MLYAIYLVCQCVVLLTLKFDYLFYVVRTVWFLYCIQSGLCAVRYIQLVSVLYVIK